MKILNKIESKNKLLKLKLVKTKVYNKSNILKHRLKIGDIEYRLKKALQIIYKFNLCEKKIVFVGNTKNIEINKLLQGTLHNFVPKFLWKNSAIKKNNALIVILDKQISLNNLKNKNSIIFLGSKLNIFDVKCSYKIPGNYYICKKKITDNFFARLLKVILKNKT